VKLAWGERGLPPAEQAVDQWVIGRGSKWVYKYDWVTWVTGKCRKALGTYMYPHFLRMWVS